MAEILPQGLRTYTTADTSELKCPKGTGVVQVASTEDVLAASANALVATLTDTLALSTGRTEYSDKYHHLLPLLDPDLDVIFLARCLNRQAMGKLFAMSGEKFNGNPVPWAVSYFADNLRQWIEENGFEIRWRGLGPRGSKVVPIPSKGQLHPSTLA